MIIHNINEAAAAHGTTPDHLNHYAYKYTDCGAWISWDEKTVTIGSIVEGSDAEFSRTFTFPFNSELADAWINDLEELCDQAWHEANDDDSEYTF